MNNRSMQGSLGSYEVVGNAVFIGGESLSQAQLRRQEDADWNLHVLGVTDLPELPQYPFGLEKYIEEDDDLNDEAVLKELYESYQAAIDTYNANVVQYNKVANNYFKSIGLSNPLFNIANITFQYEDCISWAKERLREQKPVEGWVLDQYDRQKKEEGFDREEQVSQQSARTDKVPNPALAVCPKRRQSEQSSLSGRFSIFKAKVKDKISTVTVDDIVNGFIRAF